MLNDIKKIMKKYYGIDNIELSSNFKKDFDLTSFDFINLICIIEDKYNIELDEVDLKDINTIKELIDYIKSKK